MERPVDDQHSPDSPGVPGSAWLPWLGLALLLAVQYGLFRQYVEREVSWCYPRSYDQAFYLYRSYQAHQRILTEGPWRGVVSLLDNPLGSGLMIEPEAALLSLVLGPSRLTALTVHYLHLALLEIVLVVALRYLTGRWWPGFLAVGLLLTAETPFFWAGGIADFRIDFTAFCLYGVLIGVVLRGRVFASWQWSLASGLAGALLIWTRHLTAIYVVGTGLLWLVLLLALALHPSTFAEARRRLGGLLLAGFTMAALVAPMVYLVWPAIKLHYITHLQCGEAKVREVEFGGERDVVDRAGYYLDSLVHYHAGSRFLTVAGVLVALALVLRLAWWAATRRQPSSDPRPDRFALVYALVSFLVPLTTLAVYSSPSPVVGGILVAPLLWLTVVVVLGVFPSGVRARQLASVVACVTLFVGLYTFASAMTRPVTPRALRPKFEEASKLCARISQLSRAAGWSSPMVAYTTVSDALVGPLIETEEYERRGACIHPRFCIPSGIMDITEADALAAVRASDFVVVNETEMGLDIYPFVQCMRKYRPQVLAACREGHVLCGRYALPEGDVSLYVRPKVGVSGLEHDGWVNDRGLNLTLNGSMVRSPARIEMRGQDTFHYTGKPVVHAELKVAGQPSRTLPVVLDGVGAEYRLTIDLPTEAIPEEADATVEVRFDRFFIPSQCIPNNPDPRHLVMRAPDVTALVPRP